MDIAEADRLDTQINSCVDVVRISRLAMVVCVVLGAVLAGLGAGQWALLPLTAMLPAAVNLVFHRWQLAKLRVSRRQLGWDNGDG